MLSRRGIARSLGLLALVVPASASAQSHAGHHGHGRTHRAGNVDVVVATQPVEPAAAAVHAACASPTPIGAGQIINAATTNAADRFHGTCGDGTASPDQVYLLRVSAPSHVVLQLEANYDAALYIRSQCESAASELACNDDSGDARHSFVETDLAPGDYFVVVDGYRGGNAGRFSMRVAVTPRGAPDAHLVAAAGSGSAAGTNVSPGGDIATDRDPDAPLFTGAAVTAGDGRAAGISGMIAFAKRLLTPRGLSAHAVDRVAPHFRVEAVAQDGAVVATGETGDDGRYHLDVPHGATVRVRCVSRTTYLGNDIRVVNNTSREQLYEVSSDFFQSRGGDVVNLRADVGGSEPAGAFNILTGFVKMLPFVQRGFGQSLPPLYAFWERGNNQRLPVGSITAYIRNYANHAGSFALQVMGGEQGHEDSSDSDHFDDAIVLHEFTHFVIDRLVGSFSPGGPHSWGELHLPGLALNEAVASVVAGAVNGDGRYFDTAGVEPNGRVWIDIDQESMPENVRGVGSEATNQMLQWDLVDGAEGIEDRDGDGIAIGLTGLFRIYNSFHGDVDAFPDIVAVIDRGVELGLYTRQQAAALVEQPEPQGFAIPPSGVDIYPQDVPLPGSFAGKIDGETQPAPSGGRNVPYNGFDAIRVFRVRVPTARTLNVRLRIDGDGSQESGTDLDLAVMDHNMDMVGVSAGTGRMESVSVSVQAGTYIIWVRDGDQGSEGLATGTAGNRANFILEVE